MRRENEFRYLQLAQILREQIYSGFIHPGEYLMSENELCKHYGISRTSVRKSLEQLLKEGLIVKKVGQGTIVAPDLAVMPPQSKLLRIFAISPSHFFDIGMPLLIEEFQKEHPDVEIKCLGFPAREFWDSIRTSMDLGLKPDLVFVSDRLFSEVEEWDGFADLQEPLEESFPAIYPRLRKAFCDSDRIKALPVTFSTVYLAYNPELFQRYGVPEPSEHWTKAEFLKAAGQLTLDTNGDGIPDVYGLSLSSSLTRWPVIALQNGVDFKNTEHAQPIVITLEFLHDLLYRHRTAALSPRYTLNSEAFLKEKAAMVLTTSIELAGWRTQEMSFSPRVAPLPFGENKATMLIANAFMLPEESEQPELAIRFLQKAVSPEMQDMLCRRAGFISVLQTINETTWSKPLMESLQIQYDAIENSCFLHELIQDVNVMDELESQMMLYWAGQESAAEFARRMIIILSKP